MFMCVIEPVEKYNLIASGMQCYHVHKMDLPKKYLSYSAISLWERNKQEFRERYYENKKSPETPEIILGRKIAKILESGEVAHDPILQAVPRYSHPEHKLEVTIGEIPILGYLDSFDPQTNSFLEYKTGRPNNDGSPRWDDLSVAKHEQLDIYSMLIKEKYGSVNNKCTLVWIETAYKKEQIEFDGRILEAKSSEIILTGPVRTFTRTIFEWERTRMKDKIIRIAKEIENDWIHYKLLKRDTKTG